MRVQLSSRSLASAVALSSVIATLASLTVAGPSVAAASDSTHRTSASGKVYVVDPAPEGIVAPTRAPQARAALSRSFTLHSRPGSQRTIFLDFDGASVSGTEWNGAATGLPAGDHPAWDPAGDGPSFSAGELSTIQDVWARVAEDYAPFDVDVTTADPGTAALTRSGTSDQVFGTRALITPSDQAVDAICGGVCGGLAFIDVFDEPDFHSQFQPAWIFPQTLMDDPKAVAEAVSHEVGHNFGLDHDGRGASDYYEGHGSWAPIMGAGYSRPITQWSRGDYASATRPGEDDVAIIAANGAPYRDDEDGGTRATASSALPTSVPAYVTKRSDVDYYALGTCSGQVTLRGTVASVSPNLDLQLQLVDDAGAVLAQADPISTAVNGDIASGLDATLTQSVPSGTYFAAVDGVGNGSPSTGYDDYGSLGAYRLAVTGCGGAPQPEPQPEPEPVVEAPGAPRIAKASPGSRGGGRTAVARWQPPESSPTSTDASAVSGYRLYAYQLDRSGVVVRTITTRVLGAGLRSASLGLRSGRYRFAVSARNAVGFGPLSARSNAVTAR